MGEYRKFVAAVLAAAGVIASSGLLDGQTELWVNTLVAAVGAAMVYLVENDRH